MKVKKKKIILFSVLLIFSALIITGYLYIKDVFKHPFKVGKNIKIEVKENNSLYGVIENIDSQGLLKNKYLTKYYIKNNKINPKIKPGEYSLTSEMSLEELIENLSKGQFDKNTVWVTIPEGKTLDEIANILEKNGVISKDDFIKGIYTYKLPSYIKEDSSRKYKLEGYLFPDTYLFKKKSSSDETIKLMLDRFEQVMSEIEKEQNIIVDFSKLDEKVIVASMIEGEAAKDSERNTISSVIYNRLKVNMKLQIDATVLYALGIHKKYITNDDLKIKSLYSTYYVSGLPIGPICNPGKKSIIAAFSPEKTNYIYYIADGSNTYFFATYNEFLNAKNKIQGKK